MSFSPIGVVRNSHQKKSKFNKAVRTAIASLRNLILGLAVGAAVGAYAFSSATESVAGVIVSIF